MGCPETFNWLTAGIAGVIGILAGIITTVVFAALAAAGEADLQTHHQRPMPRKRRV